VRKSGLDLQDRVERTAWGRLLISALVVVTLVSIIFSNLPGSKLTRNVLRVDGSYLNVTGLDQRWTLFAPDPRRRSIAVEGRVQYADGSTDIWRLPRGGALIGSYWDYHWQKWLEFVLDVGHPELWRPAAAFIARERNRPGRMPVRVTLIRVTALNNPPGHHPDHQPPSASPYYTLDITPAMLR
jgi:hypothetical protein